MNTLFLVVSFLLFALFTLGLLLAVATLLEFFVDYPVLVKVASVFALFICIASYIVIIRLLISGIAEYAF